MGINRKQCPQSFICMYLRSVWILYLVVIGLLFGVPTSSTLCAQENTYHFKRLTIDDGLSQSLVYTILQDDQGFMWFGTKDGLNRYDGYHFTIFRHNAYDSTSISGQEVKVLFIDRQRNLWVGTSGLNRFDPQTETFLHYLHDPARTNSLSHNTVNAIIEDSTGALWIGTSQGLNRFIPDGTAGFTHYFHQPDDPRSLSHSQITSLLIDRRGTLWVGTPMGLNAWPRNAAGFFGSEHRAMGSINWYRSPNLFGVTAAFYRS